MPSPLFRFFEIVAEELDREESRVLTPDEFDPANNDASVLDDLRVELKARSNEMAMELAVQHLNEHFEARGSQLPFTYDTATCRFEAKDKDYLKLVVDLSGIRGQGKQSKFFELNVMDRVKLRVTGALHRVGWPRDRLKTKTAFNTYLQKLGFNGKVLLEPKEKDGGLDVLWELPLGAHPYRPLVLLQCKNSVYSIEDGDRAHGPCSRSLDAHKGLMSNVHVECVFYNDYITTELLPQKRMNWVALGLSDLGAPRATAASATAI